MDDTALLQEYARTGSEGAFAALVQRHVGLVYSAAQRQVRDSQLAEDVTQAVFVSLAQKAHKLIRHPGLSGWLLQSTRFAANNHIRASIRRTRREQEAAMQIESNESSPADWSQLEALLDEAMASLGETDRVILARRYFENQSAAEIGRALEMNEETARKRTGRALEKLRKFFGKKGVALSAAALASAVSANAVQSAPAGLAAKISTVVLTAGAVATTTTTTMIILQKLLVTSVLAAAVGTGIYQTKQAADARSQMQTLQQQQSALSAQLQQLETERDEAASRLAGLQAQLAANQRNEAELLKLRGEVGVLRQQLGAAQGSGLAAVAPSSRRSRALQAGSGAAMTEVQAENACINNLRQIDAAMQQYALEHHLSPADVVTADDILPYIMGGKLPQCPSGGTYTFGSMSQTPTCSIPGHALPSSIGSPAAEQAMGDVIMAVEKDRNSRITSGDIADAQAAYRASHGGDEPHNVGEFILYLKQTGPQFHTALDTYKQSHNGQMPTNVVDLALYLQ